MVGGGLDLGVVSLPAWESARSSGGARAPSPPSSGCSFVLPILLALLPARWAEGIGKFLPGFAGQALFSVPKGTTALSPWVGFGVLCLWAAVALLAGAMTLQRGDA